MFLINPYFKDPNLNRCFLHDLLPWGLFTWTSCRPSVLPVDILAKNSTTNESAVSEEPIGVKVKFPLRAL
jgi:hypothetical protein